MQNNTNDIPSATSSEEEGFDALRKEASDQGIDQGDPAEGYAGLAALFGKARSPSAVFPVVPDEVVASVQSFRQAAIAAGASPDDAGLQEAHDALLLSIHRELAKGDAA